MQKFQEIQQMVATGLAGLDWSRKPAGLYEPIGYVLAAGGKRVRPCLALMAADMFGAALPKVLPAALALEVFHNFTLLHDDVMDHADIRRGRPTVHKKWNENTAILSGDAMTIEAYRLLATLPERHLKSALEQFSRMALEICEGQQLDVDFEQRNDVTIAEYTDMIRRKTAVLLATALQLGATVADASQADAQLLYDFGINIGLAFQIKDDYLDVYGDESTFGKAIGGDILCNKKTYMLLSAFNLADEAAQRELTEWLTASNVDAQKKIAAVTAVYDRLHVADIANKTMDAYCQKAEACLNAVSVSDAAKGELRLLAQKLMVRDN